MSIYRINSVWKDSKQDKSSLLLMLAMADAANDYGICWPGNPHLAQKCRVDTRHVRRLIRKCMEDGELYIIDLCEGGLKSRYIESGGRDVRKYKSNLYFVAVGFTPDEAREILEDRTSTPGWKIELIIRHMTDPKSVNIEPLLEQMSNPDIFDIEQMSNPDIFAPNPDIQTPQTISKPSLKEEEEEEGVTPKRVTYLDEFDGDQFDARFDKDFEVDPDTASIDELAYIDLDSDDNMITPKFDKNHWLFKRIAKNLIGTPRNLSGREKILFEEHVLQRAANDFDWMRWCIWQAEGNAEGKTFSIFIDFVTSERDGSTFEDWKTGNFVTIDEHAKLKLKAQREQKSNAASAKKWKYEDMPPDEPAEQGMTEEEFEAEMKRHGLTWKS